MGRIDPNSPDFLGEMNREWLEVFRTQHPDKDPEDVATWRRWPGDRAVPSSNDFIKGFIAGTVYAEKVFNRPAWVPVHMPPAPPQPAKGGEEKA